MNRLKYRLSEIGHRLSDVGWLILIGLAWVGCLIEDHVWTPIWWYFNKHKFERK